MASENAGHDPGSRRAALRRLIRIEEEGAYVALSGERGGDRDIERQATEYVAGVVRWRRRLDFLLGSFYRGNLEEMEPKLRQILRIGLYDLLFLRTPPYAAVNEAVSLAKSEIRAGAGGLVNGILRNIIRNLRQLPRPETGERSEDLAIWHSHPTWLVQRWLQRLGEEETVRWLEWNNRRPDFTLRVNTLRTAPEDFRRRLDEIGVECEAGHYIDYFVRVRSLQPVLRSGLIRQGLAGVQDESAGLIVRLLDPQRGEHIVDACSAPGGKALHSAQLMENHGSILAIDLHEHRMRLVESSARHQHVRIIRTRAGDFRDVARELKMMADRVLLDVPCSGLGVLAKRADMRWNRQPEDLVKLSRLQDELLDAAATVVRPGGFLVYATCTTEPEENEHRVHRFLTDHPHYDLEDASAFVPAGLTTAEGFLVTVPHRHGIDGGFGARLRRSR